MIALEWLSLVSLVFWILLILDRRRSWPAERVLPLHREGAMGPLSDAVVALVPARNEAATLLETLPALLAQDVERFRVVVVDDGSEDGTSDVARRIGKEVPSGHRIQVVEAGPRRSGWSGKVHALQCGYDAVVSLAEESNTELPEWLLLTDADIRHRPGTVASLLLQSVQVSEGPPYDLISVMARLRADSLWERLVIPAFVFFFQLLYPFRRVADRDSKVAAAAGGCVLVRRQTLEDAGGLAAIRGEIIDDVALGRAVKSRGGRIWLGLDPGIESVRGYSGLGGLWQMVSRTAFTQLGHRWGLLLLTLIALAVLLGSPPVILALGLMASTTIDPLAATSAWIRAGIWAGLAWFLMTAAYLPVVRYQRAPSVFSLTLPAAGILFGLMTAGSALEHLRGRGPTWRGRRYGPSK